MDQSLHIHHLLRDVLVAPKVVSVRSTAAINVSEQVFMWT